MSAPAPFTLSSLLDKMSNPDSDFRFMSLNDLLGLLNSPNVNFANSDANLMQRLIEAVVRALDDGNGEVQNLAVKCLGPLVLKIRENQIAPLIETLTNLSMTSKDPSIPSTALRTIITNLPRPPAGQGQPASPISPRDASAQAVNASVNAIQKTLLPKLLILLRPAQESGKEGASLDSVDLLAETVRCFGHILTGAEVENLQVAVMALLENDRTSGVIKKRAVTALSLLCVYAPDELLSSFINHLIESFRAQTTHPKPTRLRLLISVTGALARGIPDRFGPYLKTLCSFVLSVVDGKDIEERGLGDEPEMEMDEVREAALVSLESFQSCCTEEMKVFTDEVINASVIYLKYDPNYADPGSGDDEEMGGTQNDDDDDDDADFGGSDDEDAFEDDGNFSDEDDISWKVRRCAAKLLATVINTRAADLIRGAREGGGRAYKIIAPLLVDRFHEREENVRLEVLSTATLLVKKTGEVAEGSIKSATPLSDQPEVLMGPPPKKRRDSDASMMDSLVSTVPEPDIKDEHGVRKSLATLVPRLGKSVGKLLNNKAITLPTKQASVTLLSAVVSVLHGDLDDTLRIIMEPLVDAVKGGSGFAAGGNVIVASAAGGSAATATGSSVRIEVLRLLAKIFDNHPISVVGEYFGSLVPAISTAVDEKGYKISWEALGTVIAAVRLLTSDGAQPHAKHLQTLYDVVLEKVQSSDTDLDVREKAILTLGVILSRTSGEGQWISSERRSKALGVLLERLKNETTRLTAARAIEGIARNTNVSGDVDAAWVEAVVAECGGQLRKANRSLRAASLETLRSIAQNENCRSKLSKESKKELVSVITPLLVVGDMHLLNLSISIMRLMMLNPADRVGTSPEVIQGICDLIKSPIGVGVVLENLLALVGTIGEVDTEGKKELMKELLRKVGVNGETAIVAKVVAQLFCHGGGDRGGFAIRVNDFVQEVRTIEESNRKCLALMILGEIGLRMHSDFTIPPQQFMDPFKDASDDVPLAAAVALGLAGSGNIKLYLPAIMERLKEGRDSYLLVHSLKEIIQHSVVDSPSSDINPYINDIWNILITAATEDEDAKAVGAECVGRLTILDPYSFLPELQKHLKSPDVAVRGMVISALRYTFTDTDASYDELLRPIVVDFLESMLQDPELENRRLALTALNSAASNKSHLLAGRGLTRLLPLVYAESYIRPELIREIQMGPFRHRVDDGLEVRKSAYETLYALLETSFENLDIQSYYDRVIAGLQDEHDIRSLSNLMLLKLSSLAREETLIRLDTVSECFKTTLNSKPKDNAVKQEIERHKEGARAALKVSLNLQNLYASNVPSKWKAYWDWVLQTHAKDITEIIGSEDTGPGL